MDKLAQIRESEVRGVLAALVDCGQIKIASAEDFDNLASAVADNVGTSYSVDDIASVTAELLGGSVKTAEEQHETACMAALGELLMMKTADEIDDETFASAVEPLLKEAVSIRGALGKAKDMGRGLLDLDSADAAKKIRGGLSVAKQYFKDGFALKGIRDAAEKRKAAESYRKNVQRLVSDKDAIGSVAARNQLRKNFKGRVGTPDERKLTRGLGQAALAYGSAATGLGGAGYLGKKLYDKYAD